MVDVASSLSSALKSRTSQSGDSSKLLAEAMMANAKLASEDHRESRNANRELIAGLVQGVGGMIRDILGVFRPSNNFPANPSQPNLDMLR